MSSMQFDASDHKEELAEMMTAAFRRGADGYGGIKGGVQAIIEELELGLRRDNLMNDGYRIFGKFIED